MDNNFTLKVRERISALAAKFFSLATFALSTPKKRLATASLATLFILSFSFLLYSPATFPRHSLFSVDEGESIGSVASKLERLGYLKSALIFKVLVLMLDGERGVLAGDYFFEKPAGVGRLAWRFSKGQYGLMAIRLTVPEGSANKEIAKLFGNGDFPRFNQEEFLSSGKEKEGRLFPDTYYFPPNIKAAETLQAMEENFEKQIKNIQPEITAFGKSLKEVIVMASLLEEEARTSETRRRIAGILWKRLSIGMPLQVDAVFPYLLNKNTYQVTTEDLQFDSPYNTYKYKGLPPGAITNPGLDSLKAAVNPLASNYLYYLSDKNGNMHYAVTHDEHVRNKARYLK
ncbi:MAG: YceG family protein [Parcubacteria group bacterium GW2011_GWA2_47_21]|nr:MAG: YceG family protein [Parcubacteria group bacterium GW2011_GWA2_47_21]